MVFEKIFPIVWEFVWYWASCFIGIFKQSIVCWEEIPDFYFLSLVFVSVSIQNVLARLLFVIEDQGWVDESKIAIYNVGYRW